MTVNIYPSVKIESTGPLHFVWKLWISWKRQLKTTVCYFTNSKKPFVHFDRSKYPSWVIFRFWTIGIVSFQIGWRSPGALFSEAQYTGRQTGTRLSLERRIGRLLLWIWNQRDNNLELNFYFVFTVNDCLTYAILIPIWPFFKTIFFCDRIKNGASWLINVFCISGDSKTYDLYHSDSSPLKETNQQKMRLGTRI